MSKSTIGETIERLIKESKTDEDLRNKVGRLIRNDWNSNIRINNKIRQALSYRQIGKKPGIEIVGGRNHSKQDVFDAITQLLSDFYEERGSELETHYFVESLILVTKLFEHGKNRHFFPIYIPSESANVQHGYVEIEQRKQEQEDPGSPVRALTINSFGIQLQSMQWRP